jgi:hypothetical protein
MRPTLPPEAITSELVVALNSTSTAPVGESMPLASGGIEVAQAIHTPPMQLPTSIAQIAIGIPALSWPGNISAANDTMLATSTMDATTPATASRKPWRASTLRPLNCASVVLIWRGRVTGWPSYGRLRGGRAVETQCPESQRREVELAAEIVAPEKPGPA